MKGGVLAEVVDSINYLLLKEVAGCGCIEDYRTPSTLQAPSPPLVILTYLNVSECILADAVAVNSRLDGDELATQTS